MPVSPIYSKVGPLVASGIVVVHVGAVALNVPATVHKYTCVPDTYLEFRVAARALAY